MHRLILIAILVVGVPAIAGASADPCTGTTFKIGRHDIRDVALSGQCFMRVQPMSEIDTPRRDYLFAQSGEFAIYNYYGPNEIGVGFGLRVFSFFPRNGDVGFAAKKGVLAIYTS